MTETNGHGINQTEPELPMAAETKGHSVDPMTATNGESAGVKEPASLDGNLSYREKQKLATEPLQAESVEFPMTATNGRSAALDGNLSFKQEQKLAKEPLQAEAGFESDGKMDAKRRRRRRRCCCCLSCLGFLLALIIIIVILALTVFKTKDPKFTLNSVALEGGNINFDVTEMKLHVNATLKVDISLKNPNKIASFKHGDSTTVIFYSGQSIGQAVVPAGKIKADKTVRMNVSVTVYVDTVVSSGSSLLVDGYDGNLAMTTRTVMAGRVTLLGIIKKHVTIQAECSISVDVKNMSTKMGRCDKSYKL